MGFWNGSEPWFCMEADCREWAIAWSSFTDPDARDPETGERWQYMGSVRPDGKTWEHQFRHRCHPDDGQRRYVSVQASPEWAAEREAECAARP